MNHVEKIRAAYAQWIMGLAGVPADARLREAFAFVPRERFVGPSPWQVVGQAQYITITSDDPAFLYQDFAVSLRPEKHINNGQPSLHARCLSALQIKAGERVVHVGAGTGYYTAIVARLANPGGSVKAYEVDQDLAEPGGRQSRRLSRRRRPERFRSGRPTAGVRCDLRECGRHGTAGGVAGGFASRRPPAVSADGGTVVWRDADGDETAGRRFRRQVCVCGGVHSLSGCTR